MTEHKIDPETGLPQLPIDKFWRVYKVDGQLRIALMGRRPFWFPYLIDSSWSYSNPESLARSAGKILDEYEHTRRREALLGDYPPRRLEVGA